MGALGNLFNNAAGGQVEVKEIRVFLLLALPLMCRIFSIGSW